MLLKIYVFVAYAFGRRTHTNQPKEKEEKPNDTYKKMQEDIVMVF